jgi:hypothetical protein
MNDIVATLFSAPQFTLTPSERDALLLRELNELTTLHTERCSEYRGILRALFPHMSTAGSISEVPYLPVVLFKKLELSSVAPSEIFKTLRSSGTTGSVPSRIILDRDTARLQALALKHIMTSLLGPKRLPMLIVDSEAITQSVGEHSARAAGVIGMMNFGRDHLFALDSEENLRLDYVREWLTKYRNEPIFIFGFTAIVWHRFLTQLTKVEPRSAPAILVHGGGWKKLIQSAVSHTQFRSQAQSILGDTDVHDYYGMVEQVGSIYVECSQGFLHTPNFATVIVRDYRSLAPLPPGREGLIQVLSLLPRSYPGHSILTEDIGVIEGMDGCSCGWRGPYFSVRGRIPRAELRGCSDTANVGQ